MLAPTSEPAPITLLVDWIPTMAGWLDVVPPPSVESRVYTPASIGRRLLSARVALVAPARAAPLRCHWYEAAPAVAALRTTLPPAAADCAAGCAVNCGPLETVTAKLVLA